MSPLKQQVTAEIEWFLSQLPDLTPQTYRKAEYDLAKKVSATIDKQLEFNILEIESRIKNEVSNAQLNHSQNNQSQNNEFWSDVGPDVFLTPYPEFYLILKHLNMKSISKVSDLGAGYGRLGVVLGLFYPGVEFTGYEIVRERCAQGQMIFEKLGFTQHQLIEVNLETGKSTDLKPSDLVFIYDFGTARAIRHSLDLLRTIAQEQPLTVVARGRRSRDLIERETPWLSQVVKPTHFPFFSIYRSSDQAATFVEPSA